MNKKEILQKRFEKLEKHYLTIKEYKILIDSFPKLESYYLNSLEFFKRYK